MKKEKMVIGVQIVLILLAVIGGTYAVKTAYDSINASVSTGNIGVVFVGDSSVTTGEMAPISSSEVSTKALKTTFTVKGASANPSNVYYDVTLKNIDIGIGLLDQNFKFELIKNGTTISEGNFKDLEVEKVDGTLKYYQRAILTSTPQKLPSNSSTPDSYELRIYILDNGENQAHMMEQDFEADLEISLYTSKGGSMNRDKYTNLITTFINSPVLADGMIPIKWNGTTWIKASSTNSNNDWYNYDDKKWANAVMVSSDTRDSYMSDVTKPIGSEVLEDDILAYYVWIPRYRYKLFNVNSEAIDPIRIEIRFEEKTDTKSTGSTNGEWLTHPAFTFGTDELSGIWVGKFETSGTADAPTIKPNLTSLNSSKVSTQFAASQKFGTSTYLNGTAEVDAHMMKNTEWGAVAYLKQSKYGLGTTDIANNAYYASSRPYYMAGCGPASETDLTSETTTCTSYTSSAGVMSSTTGNITGVYDMAGGASEYVMGVMKTEDGTGLTYSSSEFTTSTLSLGSKYVDTYAYGTSIDDYTRRILGDATGETRGWYSDFSFFLALSRSFFERGCPSSWKSNAGVFAFNNGNGASSDAVSRSVLATQ